jgi:hypothetical protein
MDLPMMKYVIGSNKMTKDMVDNIPSKVSEIFYTRKINNSNSMNGSNAEIDSYDFSDSSDENTWDNDLTNNNKANNCTGIELSDDEKIYCDQALKYLHQSFILLKALYIYLTADPRVCSHLYQEMLELLLMNTLRTNLEKKISLDIKFNESNINNPINPISANGKRILKEKENIVKSLRELEEKDLIKFIQSDILRFFLFGSLMTLPKGTLNTTNLLMRFIQIYHRDNNYTHNIGKRAMSDLYEFSFKFNEFKPSVHPVIMGHGEKISPPAKSEEESSIKFNRGFIEIEI